MERWEVIIGIKSGLIKRIPVQVRITDVTMEGKEYNFTEISMGDNNIYLFLREGELINKSDEFNPEYVNDIRYLI